MMWVWRVERVRASAFVVASILLLGMSLKESTSCTPHTCRKDFCQGIHRTNLLLVCQHYSPSNGATCLRTVVFWEFFCSDTNSPTRREWRFPLLWLTQLVLSGLWILHRDTTCIIFSLAAREALYLQMENFGSPPRIDNISVIKIGSKIWFMVELITSRSGKP